MYVRSAPIYYGRSKFNLFYRGITAERIERRLGSHQQFLVRALTLPLNYVKLALSFYHHRPTRSVNYVQYDYGSH